MSYDSHMSEDLAMAEQRAEALSAALLQVDYLISYGMILEARQLIYDTTGENHEDAASVANPNNMKRSRA